MKLRNRLLRMFARTVGRLSTGISMSYRCGFTSGTMLDYVYRNEPSGRLWIGKLIDRIYLSHEGWESVRLRAQHLVGMLEKAVNEKLDAGDVLILDVASGPARYVLDVLAKCAGRPVTAVCRDLDERWLGEGRARAVERGIKSVRFEKGDALDRSGFESLPSAPQVVVSSGFYDWMDDDEMVRESIGIIADVVEPGGFFVFTNQTGHVDIEMANDVFIGFGGEPLKMTTRDVTKVNGWVEEKGLEIAGTESDRWGHYAVTLARKPEA